MNRSAVISRDGLYRYALHRVWDAAKPTVLFIGLNPSTADQHVDDATLRRCIRFATAWGFGQVTVANLFAFRTPSPRALRRARDPIGPRNDAWLRRLIGGAEEVVAAWGNHGSYLARDRTVLAMLERPKCLGVSRRGLPKHPLYLRATTTLRDLGRPNDTISSNTSMTTISPSDSRLSVRLPGTWRLLSRVDVTSDGTPHPDPALGSDPVALLIYDRSGHFAAQFMKRDRSSALRDGPVGAANNTQAQGGYDAYFGSYTVNDATGVVTQRLEGSLSQANVGAVLSREMSVDGNSLIIKLATAAWDGTPVTRTLSWERVG